MPKIVDKKIKREKILESAISVFAKKGIFKTKIADIAAAADVGKGTIYEYFNSKDEIFLAAFHYVIEKAERVVAKRLSTTGDPLEKLCLLFEAWKEILGSEFKEHMEIMLDFWAEGIRSKDESAAFSLKKIYDENRKLIKNILDDCVEQRKIRPVDTKIAASIIIGTMDGLIVQFITDPRIFSIKKSFDLLAQIVISGLKKG
ncbi:MAG: TetR/AcrR family transcriptional regulator [Candidatus Aminicenantes bacterium]